MILEEVLEAEVRKGKVNPKREEGWPGGKFKSGTSLN